MAQYRMLVATDAEAFEAELATMVSVLAQFAGVAVGRAVAEDISLLDAAVAPVFTRNALVPAAQKHLAEALPTEVLAWGDRLLAHPSVQASVAQDFPRDFQCYFAERSSFALGTCVAETQ